MEAKVDRENCSIYSPGAAALSGMRRGFEWDLNDWNWDGDRFVATPLNAASPSCRNKQLFQVPAQGGLNSSSPRPDPEDLGRCRSGEVEMEKRRKIAVVQEEAGAEKVEFSTLKLGGHVYPTAEEDSVRWEENNNKRSKVQPKSSNRGTCQVENCGADLSNAKDYHRRHKVCEMHAKASRALVANTVQRFCQQCSRFHLLQEFDEGKRSCRRRLAGHNKRRRKNNPLSVSNENDLIDFKDGSSLLISLLRFLSNLQGNNSEHSHNQDVSHFGRNLALLAGSFDAKNLSSLQQESQYLKNAGNSGPSADLPAKNGNVSESLRPLNMDFSSNPDCSTKQQDCPRDDTNVTAGIPQTLNVAEHPVDKSQLTSHCQISSNTATGGHACPMKTEADALDSSQKNQLGNPPIQKISSTVELARLKSFDLNDICEDDYNNSKDSEKNEISTQLGMVSLNSPLCVPQECLNSSPPQTSGSSDSSSAKSLASSNGDLQGRTDRIVFKLFGKDPNDFPLLLREQIVQWLSRSPTDIESYIKPGCVILTVYLRLPDSLWEKICCNLSSSLRRLVALAQDDFWRTGLIYARVRQQTSSIYNGQLLLDTAALSSSQNDCKILSISPIAVPISGSVDFMIRGINLSHSTKTLLCAFEGRYLMQETTSTLVDDTCNNAVNDELDCLSFSCSMPSALGRGFFEVEDYDLSGAFFPFIVAEPDLCTEICMLESTINMTLSTDNFHGRYTEMQPRTQALEFLHEMGWLLHRYELRSRAGHDSSHSNDFSLQRFKWLVKFSMEREWCATVRKLIDFLIGGAVNTGNITAKLALENMLLLHNAVEKNSRKMVEFLLRYVPDETSGWKQPNGCQDYTQPEVFLFRPDKPGPFGMTPLHLAACRSDNESLLDALISDPGQVGIIAWNSARDDTFFTPADYARSRGFKSYVDLVEQKIMSNSIVKHVVLDIPEPLPAATDDTQKQIDIPSPNKPCDSQTEKREHRPPERRCKACSRQQLAYVGRHRSSLLYRPAMFSMMGIAAVCVCVGIILKGPPEVSCLMHPFRWELLGHGSI